MSASPVRVMPPLPPLEPWEQRMHTHTMFRLIGDVAAMREDNQRLNAEVITLSLKLDSAVAANKCLASKLDDVINALMLHQGRSAIAQEKVVSPVTLRVQDRGHFGTSAVQQPRTRASPLCHGKSRLALFKEVAEDPIEEDAASSSTA